MPRLKRSKPEEPVKLKIKKGDTVLISKYGGTEIKIGGEEVIILRADDILGIVEK